MSQLKYFGLPVPGDDSRKWVPGGELPPLRNWPSGMITQSELDRAEIQYDFHCREFNIADPDDLRAYCEIRDLCLNGVCATLHIERVRYQQDRVILLEWADLSSQIPRTANHAIDPHEPPRHYL